MFSELLKTNLDIILFLVFSIVYGNVNISQTFTT